MSKERKPKTKTDFAWAISWMIGSIILGATIGDFGPWDWLAVVFFTLIFYSALYIFVTKVLFKEYRDVVREIEVRLHKTFPDELARWEGHKITLHSIGVDEDKGWIRIYGEITKTYT